MMPYRLIPLNRLGAIVIDVGDDGFYLLRGAGHRMGAQRQVDPNN